MKAVRMWVRLGVALGATTACAGSSVSTTPRPLAPQDGPRASVSVTYSGGLLNRSGDARFHTDRNAYVVVGHLTGDGTIEVLYPNDPGDPGFVRAGRTYRTGYFDASYDALPGYYSLRPAPFRTASARLDSYDGRGNGFVFIIASRMPLSSRNLTGWDNWDAMEVEGYMTMIDPRFAIRTFADRVTRGAGYTLQFARSFTTVAYSTYADAAYDCEMLSFSLLSPWFLGFQPYSFSSSGWYGAGFPSASSCDGRRYATFSIPTRLALSPPPPTTPELQPVPAHRPWRPVDNNPRQNAFTQTDRGARPGGQREFGHREFGQRDGGQRELGRREFGHAANQSPRIDRPTAAPQAAPPPSPAPASQSAPQPASQGGHKTKPPGDQ